jgi:hypothetical protein
MLLNDACHSIDTPNMGAILENVKFPNYPSSSPDRLEFEFLFYCKGIEPERGLP